MYKFVKNSFSRTPNSPDYVSVKSSECVRPETGSDDVDHRGPIPSAITTPEECFSSRLGVYDWKAVGSGGFGKVYRVKKGLKKAAVKVQSVVLDGPNPMRDTFRLWQKEVEAMRTVAEHANFVHIDKVVYLRHKSVESLYPSHMAILMEYLSLSVEDVIINRPEAYVKEASLRPLVHDHLEAIKYLQAKGIAHHDLKSANSMLATDIRHEQLRQMSATQLATFLGTMRYKLIDLGLMEVIEDKSRPVSKCYDGSPAYMAPEKADARSEKYQYGRDNYYNAFLSDCYSISTILIKAMAPNVFDTFYRQTQCRAPLCEVLEEAIDDGKVGTYSAPMIETILGLSRDEPVERWSVEEALKKLDSSA